MPRGRSHRGHYFGMQVSPPPTLPDYPFTSGQAADLGLTRQRLRLLVQQGAVRRVLRGVYAPAHLTDSVLLRAQAASLVMSPAAVLCDRSAAWLLGVDVLWRAEHDVIPPLETFVLPANPRVRRSQTREGQRDLETLDVMTLHGVPVTTPLRTALDLACGLPRRDALAALDSFMRIHEINREDFLREAPRYFRRRGVRQMRSLIPVADGRAESPGESWTRLEILDSNLPSPVLQWRVLRSGREIYRLDLAYPGLKICVEYDGEEFHDSDEARTLDHQRRAWLREHGWILIVVTKDDFSREAVTVWTEQLRRAIESRRVTVRLQPGRRTSA